MTYAIGLDFFEGKHVPKVQGVCDAFPERISYEILITNKHSKPLREQTNKIVFERNGDQTDK